MHGVLVCRRPLEEGCTSIRSPHNSIPLREKIIWSRPRAPSLHKLLIKKSRLTACESFRRYVQAAVPCACPCRRFYAWCQADPSTQPCACSPSRLLGRLYCSPLASVLCAAMPTRRPALRNCQIRRETVQWIRRGERQIKTQHRSLDQ